MHLQTHWPNIHEISIVCERIHQLFIKYSLAKNIRCMHSWTHTSTIHQIFFGKEYLVYAFTNAYINYACDLMLRSRFYKVLFGTYWLACRIMVMNLIPIFLSLSPWHCSAVLLAMEQEAVSRLAKSLQFSLMRTKGPVMCATGWQRSFWLLVPLSVFCGMTRLHKRGSNMNLMLMAKSQPSQLIPFCWIWPRPVDFTRHSLKDHE